MTEARNNNGRVDSEHAVVNYIPVLFLLCSKRRLKVGKGEGEGWGSGSFSVDLRTQTKKAMVG